jgi:HSP20 family protein
MALVRWEPARELSSLQSEMNRLFSAFFDTPTASGGGGGAAMQRWAPAMDLVETDDQFVLRADLPGVDPDDVAIELEDRVLTVSGERRADHEGSGEGFYRVERSFGAFQRTLTLPEGVDADAIAASFDNGVLEVRIPKPEERKPRRVAITPGGGTATIEGAEAEQ